MSFQLPVSSFSMEELLRTKARYGPGLKRAREFIERDGVDAPLNPRLAMYTLLHNDVDAAWYLFQKGCVLPVDQIVPMCMSEGMTKLLLILGIPLRRTEFTTLWARRVLILNGLYVPTRNWTMLTVDESDLETRRDFIYLRQSVVAILSVKKAGKLLRWDKFLLKEIALSLWDLRYEKLPRKPTLIDPVFIQALCIVLSCWTVYLCFGVFAFLLFFSLSKFYLFRNLGKRDASSFKPAFFTFSISIVLAYLLK